VAAPIESGAGLGELGVDVAWGEQAEVPDLHEAARQDVLEKATHEFEGGDPADVTAARAEEDLLVVDVEQTVVGDGDAMGVLAEVAEERGRAFEWGLGVYDPVLPVERVLEPSELGGLQEMAGMRIAARPRDKLALLEQPGEAIQELSPEEPAEHLDRQQVSLARVDPRAVVGQPAAGDDAMKMRMEREIAPPRVHHAGDADQCTEALRILTEGHDGLGGGDEQQVEQGDLVLADQRAQFGGKGEHDVEVAHRQRALHAGRDPAGLAQGLALGAMAIAAGVI
jgi:hypothetical protein